MKIFKIVLKGLIWLMFIVLFCTIGALISWYGYVEPVSKFMRIVAIATFVSIPSYILTSKVMKHVKID